MASKIQIGDVGYEFSKFFSGHGWYDGKVYEVLPNGWRRCVYSDGDKEDVDIKTLEKLAKQARPRSASKRKAKSRLINIDGHMVLKENNYTVNASTYVHGREAGRDRNSKKQKSLPPKISKEEKNEATYKQTREVTPKERIRMEHKNAILDRAQKHLVNQRYFFAEHIDSIAPFLDPVTAAQLRTEQKNVTSGLGIQVMQPKTITGGEMRSYQLAGLNWMANMHRRGMPMIIGDEMGLGKTLQTISLICYLKEELGAKGPSLVICPLSVLYSWCTEVEKWAPSLKCLRYHSSDPNERENMKKSLVDDLLKYDIVVTTYEMAKSSDMKSLWSRIAFNYLVLDEGHIIKNREALISDAVRRVHSESRLVLTGTPLQNDLEELWSILEFLYPTFFTKQTLPIFQTAFDITQGLFDQKQLEEAHKMLQLFMVRRLKAEVEKLLPKKIETRVICPLSKQQLHWYKGIVLKEVDLLARIQSGATTTNAHQQLNNMVMQLRKTCCHPFLHEGAEISIDNTTVDELVAASGKLAVTDMLLSELYKNNNRVVFFSQFTRVLDIVQDYCDLRGWKYVRLDGGVPRAVRNLRVNKFNDKNSDTFLFLMSTKAGGMGLNLQTADTVIIHDSDWNPQADAQAMARVHRIGQKKTVHVYRLVCGGTIEERILQRAEKKMFLDQMVNHGSKAGINDEEGGGLSTKDLFESIAFGSDAIFGDSAQTKNALPNWSDIQFLVDRKRSGDETNEKLKAKTAKTAKNFDLNESLASTTKLHGIDFGTMRNEKENWRKNLPKNVRPIADSFNELGEFYRTRKATTKRVVLPTGGKYDVLIKNDYSLEDSFISVFDRELKGQREKAAVPKKRVGKHFDEHMEYCQACGDDKGSMFSCPTCPVSMHLRCFNKCGRKHTRTCTHHNCIVCDKSRSAAGGLVYACQACANAYCEDCLPQSGVTILNTCPIFEDHGFDWKTHGFQYINCSEFCQNYAIEHLNWKVEDVSPKMNVEPLSIDWNFGGGGSSLKKETEKSTSITNVVSEVQDSVVGFCEYENKPGTAAETSSKSVNVSSAFSKNSFSNAQTSVGSTASTTLLSLSDNSTLVNHAVS